MNPKMNPNEVVIKACVSKHYSNKPARKGKLVLTNQRLFFWPSEKEDSINLIEIWPKEICELHFFNTLLLIPNGINIITKNGNHNMFRVNERNIWTRMINQMY